MKDLKKKNSQAQCRPGSTAFPCPPQEAAQWSSPSHMAAIRAGCRGRKAFGPGALCVAQEPVSRPQAHDCLHGAIVRWSRVGATPGRKPVPPPHHPQEARCDGKTFYKWKRKQSLAGPGLPPRVADLNLRDGFPTETAGNKTPMRKRAGQGRTPGWLQSLAPGK